MIQSLSEFKARDHYVIILKSQTDYLIRNLVKSICHTSPQTIAGVGFSKGISSMKTKECSGIIVCTD